MLTSDLCHQQEGPGVSAVCNHDFQSSWIIRSSVEHHDACVDLHLLEPLEGNQTVGCICI